MDVIHQGLEDGWRVRQPKWHHQVLIQASGGIEGGYPFVFILDAQQVVGIAEIQPSEDGASE